MPYTNDEMYYYDIVIKGFELIYKNNCSSFLACVIKIDNKFLNIMVT